MLQSIFFISSNKIMWQPVFICLTISKVPRILMKLMITFPLWGKSWIIFVVVVVVNTVLALLLLSWLLLVEGDQWAPPPPALSTGDWCSHPPITKRLQSGLVVTLDLSCRTIIGELCEKSLPSVTRYFSLQPSSAFQLPVSVHLSRFSRQKDTKRFFSPLRSPGG